MLEIRSPKMDELGKLGVVGSCTVVQFSHVWSCACACVRCPELASLLCTSSGPCVRSRSDFE